MAGVLTELPADTVRLIGSTQVITSVFSVIKELIENALDAESTNIDIKLENFGLDRIEVRDNGKGIGKSDIPFVAKQHYTSKIISHADLEKLKSYGFRGEALASLCSVADVSITTKTSDDEIGMTYDLASNGAIVNEKPSHLGNGTLIVASNLFKNLPVRKHYYNTNKKKKEELKKTEDLLISFGIICPQVRIIFRHNKETLWQKNVMPDMKSAILSVLGRSVSSQLEFKHSEHDEPKVDMNVFLPKPDSDILVTSRTSCERSFLFVNSRPVTVKEIEKLIRIYYCNSYGCDNNRHPIFVVAVTIPPNEIDVNVDPNKTKVLLHQLDGVKKCLEEILLYMYGPLDSPLSWRRFDKQTEIQPKEDNSKELRVLGSQFCRQESDESNRTSNFSQSDVSLETSLVKNTHLSKQDNKPKTNFLEKKPDTLNKTSDSGFSENDLRKNEELDLEAASCWEIDLAEFEQSQLGLENEINTQHSVSCFSATKDVNKKLVENESKISSVIVIEDKDQSHSTQEKHISVETSEKAFEHNSSVGVCEDNISDELLNGLMGTYTEKESTCDKSFNNLQSSVLLTDKLNIKCQNRNPEVDRNFNVVRHDTSDVATNEEPRCLKSSNLDQSDVTFSAVSAGGEEDWSRGRSVTANGKLVQPVTLLSPSSYHTPGKRPHSPPKHDILPPEKRRATGSHQIKPLSQGQTTLYDIIDNHPVERELGFKMFIKDVHPEVEEQNPLSSEEEIGDIIKEKWKNLSETEKLKYSSLVNNRTVNALGTPNDISNKVKKKLDKGRSVRDQLLSQMKKSTKKTKKKPEKPTKDVPFSLSNLKQNFTSRFRQTPAQLQTKKNLIGCLRSCGAWVCSQGNDLLLVNPHRMCETVLHHQLMEQHRLCADQLEKPVPLSASVVGDDLFWQTLISLAEDSWSRDPRVYIADERVTANGLKIQCYRDSGTGEIVAELVGASRLIPMYGVRDLCEILELITNTGATTLYESRPLKVINYLKSEAVRMARQSPGQRSNEDMSEMLVQVETLLPSNCSTCLHDKPFFHTLCDLTAFKTETFIESQISQE